MSMTQKNALVIATLVSFGLAITGCAKHEQAEGGKNSYRTEEIAAKQGEAARAAVKEPEAKEPATFTATTAPASGAATTATASASTATATSTNTATASSVTEKMPSDSAKPIDDTKKVTEKAVVKQTTTTVTTKTDEKK